MSKVKQVAVLNVGWLAGITISLFTVPGNTPFWLWACIAGVSLCALNAMVLLRQRQRPDQSRPSSRTAAIIIYMGVALLIIDVILSRYFGSVR